MSSKVTACVTAVVGDIKQYGLLIRERNMAKRPLVIIVDANNAGQLKSPIIFNEFQMELSNFNLRALEVLDRRPDDTGSL